MRIIQKHIVQVKTCSLPIVGQLSETTSLIQYRNKVTHWSKLLSFLSISKYRLEGKAVALFSPVTESVTSESHAAEMPPDSLLT